MVDVPPANPRCPASPTLCGSLVTPRASTLRPSRWPCPGPVVVVVYPLRKQIDDYDYHYGVYSRETAVDHGKARTEDSSSARVRPLCPSCPAWRRPGATSVFGHAFTVEWLELRTQSTEESPGRRPPPEAWNTGWAAVFTPTARRGLSAAGHDTRSVRDSLPGIPLGRTIRPYAGVLPSAFSQRRRTGTALTFSTTSLCANRSAGSCSVQPAGPSGGPEQAGAIRRGSP